MCVVIVPTASNPIFSYRPRPNSVAVRSTVAPPAWSRTCSISLRPSPMRPYLAATSTMLTTARSGP